MPGWANRLNAVFISSKLPAVAAIIVAALFLTARAQAAPIELGPGDGIEVFCGQTPAAERGCLAAAFGGKADDYDLYYKSNAGSADEGPFAGSYDTEYDDPGDAEDATISYLLGQLPISCPSCYLVVVNGAINPIYLFDISAWDGISRIILTGFYPAQGAISHVAIYGFETGNGGGGTAGQEIPEPASLLLLAGGLGAAAFTARRRLKARRS